MDGGFDDDETTAGDEGVFGFQIAWVERPPDPSSGDIPLGGHPDLGGCAKRRSRTWWQDIERLNFGGLSGDVLVVSHDLPLPFEKAVKVRAIRPL